MSVHPNSFSWNSREQRKNAMAAGWFGVLERHGCVAELSRAHYRQKEASQINFMKRIVDDTGTHKDSRGGVGYSQRCHFDIKCTQTKKAGLESFHMRPTMCVSGVCVRCVSGVCPVSVVSVRAHTQNQN